MRSIRIPGQVRPRATVGVVGAARPIASAPVLIAIAGTWVLAIAAQATGNAALLHHHALIEGGPPLLLAVPVFLLSWQVMVAAMMLPASLPTIRVVEVATSTLAHPRTALAAFIAAFAVAWSAFGLGAFLGDDLLHRVVDATPWLADRGWLIEATVVALAGAYQLTGVKRQALAACRHPDGLLSAVATSTDDALRMGIHHGLACLGSSWALMLLVFAEGFASLGWMAALTAVMAYEATGRHGQRAAQAVGVVLLLVAVVTVAGSMPARV